MGVEAEAPKASLSPINRLRTHRLQHSSITMEGFKMEQFESMKKPYNELSAEDKKKRRFNLLVPAAVTTLVSIAMIAIGKYFESEDKVGAAPSFLIVGGAVQLVGSAAKLLAFLTPCKCDDKLADAIGPLVDFAYFIVIIWGSVKVFGAYSEWTYEVEEADTFCPYTPFIFAFVTLVAYWVLLPLMCCCTLMSCCCGLCAKDKPSQDQDQV